MADMRPTVGRRVWVWAGSNSGTGFVALDQAQPFDAGVLFVHPDGSVNLAATDHTGNTAFLARAELRAPDERDTHEKEGPKGLWATWMPYQVKKEAEAAAANDAKKPPFPPPKPTPKP